MLLKQFLLCLLTYQFLLLVMVNGSPEVKPKPNSLYPFSKAQLESNLNQQEMDKRIEGAKHWDKKLEQILNKYKDNLKSFFSADEKLKSRAEILRDAFREAIKNKNLMDLIELLVTATAEEKETFKKLKYCEQLKKIFKKDLMGILFALCANQRETAFDLSREQEEIEKDQEMLTHLTNPKFDRHQLIPMLTTKSYPYLREVFAKENNYARWYMYNYGEQDKFYKVIRYIVQDAVDGRPKFYSELLYNSLKLLYIQSKGIGKKLVEQKLFVNYTNVHKAFQRILATRAQIDLADIVRVKKEDNNINLVDIVRVGDENIDKSLRSFGHAIGTLKQMKKSYHRDEKKKLFSAYIEILESVRDHAGIDKSEEQTIKFDRFRSTGSGGGSSLFSGGGGISAGAFAYGLGSGKK